MTETGLVFVATPSNKGCTSSKVLVNGGRFFDIKPFLCSINIFLSCVVVFLYPSVLKDVGYIFLNTVDPFFPKYNTEVSCYCINFKHRQGKGRYVKNVENEFTSLNVFFVDVFLAALSRKRSDTRKLFQVPENCACEHALKPAKQDRSRSSKPFIKYSSSLYFDNLWICNYIFVKVSELRIISRVTQRLWFLV